MANQAAQLPASDHKFWDGAEKIRSQMTKLDPCKHSFVQSRGREVNCNKCNIGFYLTAGAKVRDGSLVYKGKKIL